MRLFIAINFTENIKDALMDAAGKLKKLSSSGNFTRRENLHQTLVFLGEVEPSRVKAARRIMDSCFTRPAALTISGMGRFRREGADLWWAGVKADPAIYELVSDLNRELKDAGFHIEDRPYKPHITLCRQLVLNSRPEFELPELSMDVEHISLMKSERIAGKLTYTEIYRAALDRAAGG